MLIGINWAEIGLDASRIPPSWSESNIQRAGLRQITGSESAITSGRLTGARPIPQDH
ncbi:hypothetical protein BD293_0471 [Roseinatronobacter monicus]|uniref:Uncharacterized protein n=1 Tax=Roseinatronobacter monicus TaxID=393481 RepID=A0A543KA18_9RHOB|nr:hypothetical protein BD293_0471 [Roseinatronobacter monicus]